MPHLQTGLEVAYKPPDWHAHPFFFGHHFLFLLGSSYLIGMKRCGTVLRSAAGVTCPHIGRSACHERCHRSCLPRGDVRKAINHPQFDRQWVTINPYG